MQETDAQSDALHLTPGQTLGMTGHASRAPDGAVFYRSAKEGLRSLGQRRIYIVDGTLQICVKSLVQLLDELCSATQRCGVSNFLVIVSIFGIPERDIVFDLRSLSNMFTQTEMGLPHR